MLLFLHIPKTAGSSFRFILENTFGLSHCHAGHTKRSVFTQADLRFAQRFFPGLRSIAGHNLVDPLRLTVPQPFYMTFLREPVSRAISHYQDTVLRGENRQTFEEYLRENRGLENLHVKLMAGERNLDKAKRFLARCDIVGLTEKFNLSLHVLQRLCPEQLNLSYRKKVVAKDNSIRKSIESDPRLLDIAREHNRLDLELYSFAVNEIFPSLCERAGLRPDEKVASFETSSDAIAPRYSLGRFYNRIFRQACKFRRNSKSVDNYPEVSAIQGYL